MRPLIISLTGYLGESNCLCELCQSSAELCYAKQRVQRAIYDLVGGWQDEGPEGANKHSVHVYRMRPQYVIPDSGDRDVNTELQVYISVRNAGWQR